jgi:hypothetical protein
MAQIVINTAEALQLCNPQPATPPDQIPTLVLQLAGQDAGVYFDVTGDHMPLLTAHDARKVAKWLNKAADMLDGTKSSKRKGQKKMQQWYDDDDENPTLY